MSIPRPGDWLRCDLAGARRHGAVRHLHQGFHSALPRPCTPYHPPPRLLPAGPVLHPCQHCIQVLTVLIPSGWIIPDVTPHGRQRPLVSQDAVIIPALPHPAAGCAPQAVDPPGDQRFEIPHDRTDRPGRQPDRWFGSRWASRQGRGRAVRTSTINRNPVPPCLAPTTRFLISRNLSQNQNPVQVVGHKHPFIERDMPGVPVTRDVSPSVLGEVTKPAIVKEQFALLGADGDEIDPRP